MKVNAWKNIDLEVEVDVSIDDLIQELHDIASSTDGWRRKLSAIDGASKVLSLIGSEPLEQLSSHRLHTAQAIRDRLLPLVVWAERQLLESALTEPSTAQGLST